MIFESTQSYRDTFTRTMYTIPVLGCVMSRAVSLDYAGLGDVTDVFAVQFNSGVRCFMYFIKVSCITKMIWTLCTLRYNLFYR